MTEDEKPLSLQAEERAALQRIALSPDGHLLHRYLRRVLEAVWDDPPDSALRSQNGRRSLARDLMREMAQGIEDTARGGSGKSGSGERSILTGPRQPAVVGRQRRSVREQLIASDPELASLARKPAEPTE